MSASVLFCVLLWNGQTTDTHIQFTVCWVGLVAVKGVTPVVGPVCPRNLWSFLCPTGNGHFWDIRQTLGIFGISGKQWAFSGHMAKLWGIFRIIPKKYLRRMFKPILAHLPLPPQSIPEMACFHASRTPSNCTGCPAGCPAGFHVRVFWKTKGIFKSAEKDKVFESARHSARRPPHCTRGIARHFPWCSPRRVAAADAMTTSHDASGWWRPICLARFDTGRSVSCGEMSIIVSSGTRRSRSLSSSGWTSRTNGGRGSYGCTERICRSCARRSSSISGGSMVASSGAPAARSATSAPSECRRVPLLDTPPPQRTARSCGRRQRPRWRRHSTSAFTSIHPHFRLPLPLNHITHKDLCRLQLLAVQRRMRYGPDEACRDAPEDDLDLREITVWLRESGHRVLIFSLAVQLVRKRDTPGERPLQPKDVAYQRLDGSMSRELWQQAVQTSTRLRRGTSASPSRRVRAG